MKPLRILIVDDDMDALATLDRTLSNVGHETRMAPNGKVAVRLAKEFNPDVVVTDILMPEKDGYEVIIELRRAGSGAKIIAMSAGGDLGLMTPDIAGVLKAFKVDTFLQKPVHPAHLFAALDKVTATA